MSRYRWEGGRGGATPHPFQRSWHLDTGQIFKDDVKVFPPPRMFALWLSYFSICSGIFLDITKRWNSNKNINNDRKTFMTKHFYITVSTCRIIKIYIRTQKVVINGFLMDFKPEKYTFTTLHIFANRQICNHGYYIVYTLFINYKFFLSKVSQCA